MGHGEIRQFVKRQGATKLTARSPQIAANPGSGITKANVRSERRDTGQKNQAASGFVIVIRWAIQ